MAMLMGANLSGVYTTLDEGNTPALGDVFFGTGAKVYKFIQYEAATAAISGVALEVAYYYLLDGYKNNIVTSDVSDATGDIGAGVMQVILADGEYGWVQIKGPATLSIALTTATDGAPLTPTGAGDGTLEVAADTTASAPQNVCAWAGDASDKEIICDFVW